MGGSGGSTRSKPAELKTIPATQIVLGNHTTDEVIRKSLCEALAREREGVSVDNFTGMGVEIARDTRAIVGVQGGALSLSEIWAGQPRQGGDHE